MAVFVFPYGRFEIESSINKFISGNLLTSLPAWAPSINLVYNYPNQPLVPPCFSVTHFPASERPGVEHQGDRADGTNKGRTMMGMFEVDCWVSSAENADFKNHLLTMRDMVVKLFRNNPAIQIVNAYSGTLAPTNRGAIIRVTKIQDSDILPDPNPALKRIKINIYTFWEERF